MLGGCATIFTGTSDAMRFDANVPGVRLSIDGRYEGELPLAMQLSRSAINGQQFSARFEKEGYVTQEFVLTRSFNAVAVLDISSTVVSGGIDILTGAWMKFSPVDYHVQMLAAGESASSREFQRGIEVYRFGLTNYRRLTCDLARGGGEYLDAFAALLADSESGRELISARAVSQAPQLVSAPDAENFVRRFGAVLDADPLLRRYQFQR